MVDKYRDARITAHEFLKNEAAISIEPRLLLAELKNDHIVDDEEAACINHEPTQPLRLYCLFVSIIPTKGYKVIERIGYILKKFSYDEAAELWLSKYASSRISGYSGDVVDGIVAPIMAPIFMAVHQSPEPVTAHYESYQRAAVIESGQNQQQRRRVIDEESIVDVVYTRGHGAPPAPSPMLRSDLGSAGVLDRTPVEFLDDGPDFQRNAVRARDGFFIDPNNITLSGIIGHGGFANVYSGKYQNRKVAVKQFRDYDEFSLSMFIAEIDIMKNLDHKNILKFVGYVHVPADRKLWLLTEYIVGGPLRRFCTSRDKNGIVQKLPMRDKLFIASSCWLGLDYLHSKNLCHKDISPENILVSTDLAQIKISDFGLAEFKTLMISGVSEIRGTAMYYPPEYASDDGIIRHPIKSDVYSMGASQSELFSEQWFWNINGQPRNSFQVMFVLSDLRRNYDEKRLMRMPDCWDQMPSSVQVILIDAITPDYQSRKTAKELYMAIQTLLKSFP